MSRCEDVLTKAIEEVESQSPHETDGKWLEFLTAKCAPLLAEWDCRNAWHWSEWPDRPSNQDVGVDVVAERNDGALIAIQCKSRKLENGKGQPISKKEIRDFTALASGKNSPFDERWLVVNGAVSVGSNALPVMDSHDIAHINLHAEILRHLPEDTRPPVTAEGKESRDAMQEEAVGKACRDLRALSASTGCSRGRIILPCGTGKSRIALRIIEEMTGMGEVSAILSPSIALVSQLRHEFLLHGKGRISALAVCSDKTAARGSEEDLANNQAADLSQASARDVKGRVTTDPTEINEWIKGINDEQIGVIFGTYQSSSKIAEALRQGRHELNCMIADEAHRTAGIKRVASQEEILRDFTVCHDQRRFPAKYRVYQTATPKVFKTSQQRKADERLTKEGKWVVRSMDDENVFGPELYRRSYTDAVENGWLSDYRIIALGVNDEQAYKTANDLAGKEGSALSTVQVIRGLALAMVKAGATSESTGPIKSSISFLNTTEKSKQMVDVLQSEAIRNFVSGRLKALGLEEKAREFRLQHLDAKSSVADREEAIAELDRATHSEPKGILNVGIFGEGVDVRNLSAVGFIEPRKSPVDVIQAVGRVMRTSADKRMGYIICPIVIPKNVRAEDWMACTTNPDDGWQSLGQILLALRAHDERIEEKLSDLMELYLPGDDDCEPKQPISTVVGIPSESRRMVHYIHEGKAGEAQAAVADCAEGKASPKERGMRPLNEAYPDKRALTNQPEGSLPNVEPPVQEPQFILTGKPLHSTKTGETVGVEVRQSTVVRDKPSPLSTLGAINIDRTKKKALKMINGEDGRVVPNPRRIPRQEQIALRLIQKSEVERMGIHINLLERSGLSRNPAARSVNMLEDAISEGRLRLREDGLEPALAKHFQITGTKKGENESADGCTIAALLLMNAAMLHQRIVAGGWLARVKTPLGEIKSSADAKKLVLREWNHITRHDFAPVIEPAIDVITAIEDSGCESGLQMALRHLTGEAERLAADYAEMGADYAGELFNKVMGNQASDGAFFTKPNSAALLAGLVLDVAIPLDADWTDAATWQGCRLVDLACGSGTLLAASLTEMKRRAARQGADADQLAAFQKLTVEDSIAGLDFNPVSLQLAAAQLTSGNFDVAYGQIGLYRMPYGLTEGQVRVGTLELLGQRSVLRIAGLDLDDEALDAKQVQMDNEDLLPKGVAAAVKNARIVIMNPPFTNRSKMGEKFPKDVQQAMRKRVDSYDGALVATDPEMEGFGDKNSIRPLFVALADRCLDPADGVLAMINPTIALTSTSGQQERVVLARRFYVHTLLTCHQPKQITLSQKTSINESMVILKRHEGARPPTRVVGLDRLPLDEDEAAELHRHLSDCAEGLLPDGWGEISEWSAEHIGAGDWSAAAFRSPELAESAWRIANDEEMLSLRDQDMVPSKTGPTLSAKSERSAPEVPGSFPILDSKGAAGQFRIQAAPDQYWIPKKRVLEENLDVIHGIQNRVVTESLLQNAGHLMVAFGQRTSTARLTATASDERFVGNGWMPVAGVTPAQAKATAVFLNSTAGRLQLLRNPAKSLDFPTYNPAAWGVIKCPDIRNDNVIEILEKCWHATAGMDVPQFRDGECEVRRLWDEAVCSALGWDIDYISNLRQLLNAEPHVCGRGINQHF